MTDQLDVIERDLEARVQQLKDEGQPLYAMRLRQRTQYDLEMMRQIGFCTGIENYSRYFDGRQPGDAPYCLLDYFPKDFLMFIDESHAGEFVVVPAGMRHRPVATTLAKMLMVELAGTLNKSNSGDLYED